MYNLTKDTELKKTNQLILTILCFSIGLAQLNGCKAKTTIEEASQNDDDSTSTTDTCTTVGQACTSGAIYAGEYDYTAANPSSPYKYSVIPIGCDGTTTNPVCNGTDDQNVIMNFLDQAHQGNNDDVTTSFTNAQMLDGQLLTSTLANYNTAGAVFTAAQYCQNLTYGGFTDWYLPTKEELGFLYTAIGNQFEGYNYFSSSEEDANSAWYVDMSYGGGAAYAKTDSYRIRCVRRWN